MKKYLLSIGVIVFSFVCANSLLAQDVQEMLEKKMEECIKLKEERDAIKDEFKKLSSENKSLTKDTVTLNKELSKIKKLLEKQEKKNSKPELDALCTRIAQMQADSASSKELYAKAQERIIALETELEKLTPFRALYVKAMLERQKTFLSMPFSQLNTDTLKQVIQECNTYKDAHIDIAKGIKLFENLLKDKAAFDSIGSLLHNPYDKARINKIRSESGLLGMMLQSYKETPQFTEIDALDIKLSRYESAVFALKDFIRSFNEEVSLFRNEEQSKAVKDYLKDIIQNDKETIALIEEIPFLKAQWNKYKEDIFNKPLEILKIEEKLEISMKEESVY